MTKILLMNIPSGPYPTDFPPFAISRVIEGLDPQLNCETYFYDLDYFRPSFEEIKNKVQSYMPDIIGFSAILTPAYSYVKKLSIFLKNNFPNIIQVLGGEMAVISNIILRYGLVYMIFPKKIRRYLLKYLIIIKVFGLIELFRILYKKFTTKKTKNFINITSSLRKINRNIKTEIRKDDINTFILREGR